MSLVFVWDQGWGATDGISNGVDEERAAFWRRGVGLGESRGLGGEWDGDGVGYAWAVILLAVLRNLLMVQVFLGDVMRTQLSGFGTGRRRCYVVESNRDSSRGALRRTRIVVIFSKTSTIVVGGSIISLLQNKDECCVLLVYFSHGWCGSEDCMKEGVIFRPWLTRNTFSLYPCGRCYILQ